MSVYFIQRGWRGPIKIGTATDPYARLSALQTGSPTELRLIGIVQGSYEQEAELHRIFDTSRILGEWFQPTPELLGMIGDAYLDVAYAFPSGRKMWRDATLADLMLLDNRTWEAVELGAESMVAYDDWRGFYSPVAAVLINFPTIGDAVAAGAFAESFSDRRSA